MRRPASHRQSGFMILETLLALVIFSLGVLGLIGLQANAAKQSGQAQYRATATVLANELIGQMWVGNRSSAALQATYASASTDAGFTAWKAKVAASLPNGATEVTLTQKDPLAAVIPVGTVNIPTVPPPSTQVMVKVKWRLPAETVAETHNVVLVTQISVN